ncbi:MAG: SpoIIE family protein phosphatase [Casimicrobiaceae bacterium]
MSEEPQTEALGSATHTVYVSQGKPGLRKVDRVHYLVVEEGLHAGERILLTESSLRLGREEPCEIVLRDPGISRSHCRVERRFDEIVITDLGSTNGSFVDDQAVVGTIRFPVGSVLRVGQHVLRHEQGTRKEFEDSRLQDKDILEARGYIEALLPAPWRSGPVRTEWLMLPSAKLGGDALGHHAMSAGRLAFYLVDVSGHGARAAMHSVAVINVLRHQALPNCDFGRPEQVLRELNSMFEMESHGEMYFTIWYGVYEIASRQLTYASAGHHPAFLVPPSRESAIPLRTPNIPVGTMPGFEFSSASVEIPAGAMFYLFSDGVFELVKPDGTEAALSDFIPLLVHPHAAGQSETKRLHNAAIELGGRDSFDDDFSILIAEFE